MKPSKMSQAEEMRYAKIQRLTDLLCKKDELMDAAAKGLCAPFKVGGRITVDGTGITIGKKTYDALELKRITINTEGSLSIYERSGKRLCGRLTLNLSSKNIELFCMWVRKNGIPAEAVSGKGERTILIAFSVIIALIAVLMKILKYIYG